MLHPSIKKNHTCETVHNSFGLKYWKILFKQESGKELIPSVLANLCDISISACFMGEVTYLLLVKTLDKVPQQVFVTKLHQFREQMRLIDFLP